MKQMSCKDMGGMDCDFVAKGETVEDVKKAMNEHAQEAHADVLAKMTDEEKSAADAKMDELIKDEE